jgi:hypothetical protein
VSAFLHGFLQESVYMVQSPRFIDLNAPSIVCHLKKAIYGLNKLPEHGFNVSTLIFLILVFMDLSLTVHCLLFLKAMFDFLHLCMLTTLFSQAFLPLQLMVSSSSSLQNFRTRILES